MTGISIGLGAMARTLRMEETALLMMGLGGHGVGDYNFALSVDNLG